MGSKQSGVSMGRKGKTQKHTAKEIASKHAAAKAAASGAGGGGDMADKRKSAGNKVSVQCTLCMTIQPNIKSMEAHYDGKHAKVKWADEKAKYEEMFKAAKANK